jgi:hypothetical protein
MMIMMMIMMTTHYTSLSTMIDIPLKQRSNSPNYPNISIATAAGLLHADLSCLVCIFVPHYITTMIVYLFLLQEDLNNKRSDKTPYTYISSHHWCNIIYITLLMSAVSTN